MIIKFFWVLSSPADCN